MGVLEVESGCYIVASLKRERGGIRGGSSGCIDIDIGNIIGLGSLNCAI